MGLDTGGGASEVEATRPAGMRLKIEAVDPVDCFGPGLGMSSGSGGAANTGGFMGRTSADLLILDWGEA